MEAPKCRLCGERHWGVCKQVSLQGVNNIINKAVIRVKPAVSVNSGSLPVNKGVLQEEHICECRICGVECIPVQRIDRKVYMREYMRKRRAGL